MAGLTNFNVLLIRCFACAALLAFGCTNAYAQSTNPLPPATAAFEGLSFIKKLKLARAGDDLAQLSVALDYENGLNSARKDVVQAARWYREAALLGNVDAQYRLAKLVSGGAPDLPQDLGSALKLFQSAAERGHIPSQNEMGLRLQKGDGVAVDLVAAVKWYEKAASQNYAPAQVNLGLLYVKGQGADQNLAEAFKLFERAADTGDAWALNNLGSMYEMGWGTGRNLEKAKSLYQEAMSRGNKMAEVNLRRLVDSAAATTATPD